MKNDKSRKWQLFLVIIVSGAILIGSGIFYYRYEQKSIRKEIYNDLHAIGSLKINQIVQWKKERLGDANIIMHREVFHFAAERLSKPDKDSMIFKNIHSQMNYLINQYGYENILITDPGGELFISVKEQKNNLDSKTRQFIMESARRKEIVFTDFYRDTENHICLDIIVPLINKYDKAYAMVLLRIDPCDYLYPLIQSWPVASNTAETVLLRKEGDEILFLNELRHIPNSALSLRIPVTNLKVPGVQAAIGNEGVYEGYDYRHKKVVSDIRAVPETPWFMVSKIDRDEVYSELRYRTIIIIVFIFVLMLLISASLAWIYQLRQNKIYRSLHKAKKILSETENEFRTTLYSIGDAVITFDKEEKIKNLNPVAESLTGWKENEAIGKNVSDIFNIRNEKTKMPVNNFMGEIFKDDGKTGFSDNVLLITKINKEIPVSVSGAPIRNDKNELIGIILVFRDQTEERKRQKILIDNERRIQNLFRHAGDGILILDANRTIVDTNNMALDMLGYNREELLDKDITGILDLHQSEKKGMQFPKDDFKIPRLQEWKCLRKNGSVFPVEASVQMVSEEEYFVIMRDLTSRYQMEEALRESERKFRETVINLDEGYYSVTPDGILLEHNQAFNQLLGFEKTADLKGARLPDFWQNPDERKEYLQELKQKGSISNYQIGAKTIDGKKITVIASAHFVYNEDNQPIRIEGVFLDITERLKKEEQLRNSEERYRSTLDNMMEGCQILGFDWEYLYINDTASIHSRRLKEELLGKKYTEIWPDIELTEFYKILKNCMEKRASKHLENKFIFPDGSEGWFDLTIQPVPEGVFILSIDISERKKSEINEKLTGEVLDILNNKRDTASMIKAVIRSIKQSIGMEAIGIRLKKDEDFPYYLTDGFNQEFLSDKCYLCMHDNNGNLIRDKNGLPELDCMCGDVIRGKVNFDSSFFTKGGSFRSNNKKELKIATKKNERYSRLHSRCRSERYESVAFIPVRSGTEVIGLLHLNDQRAHLFTEDMILFLENLTSNIGIAIARNIAEEQIRQMNAELENRVTQRTSQLEAANKELEAFSYSVSHDLRAPLRHISGFTDLLVKNYREILPDKAAHYMDTIAKSTQQMGLLIDDLLEFSRTGRTEVKKSIFQMDQLLDEVMHQVKPLCQDRIIEWEITSMPEVTGDQSLLRTVWTNLLSNAIKYTRQKEVARIEVGCNKKENEYIFYVRDNGVGFDMKYVQKLFGVFQRLHAISEFEGTGIGLANVRRIIMRHGGRTWAEGKPGEGAVFYFTLPCYNMINQS